MSVTLILLYCLLYFLSITAFLLILSTTVSVHTHTNFNFIALLSFYNTYTNLGFFLYLPLLGLAGLPPVGVFFLKIALLLNILPLVSVVVFFLVFLCLFFNMLFYLQVFKATRNYNLVTNDLLDTITRVKNARTTNSKNLDSHSKFIVNSSSNFYKYNLIYLVILLLTVIILFACFNLDVYYILLNLVTI